MTEPTDPLARFRAYVNMKALGPVAIAAPLAAATPVIFNAHVDDCEIRVCHDYARHADRHPADLPERHYPLDGQRITLAYASGSSTSTQVFNAGWPVYRMPSTG